MNATISPGIRRSQAAWPLAAAALVLSLAAGNAAATTWQGGTGSWFEPRNWTFNVPTSSSGVWIDNGGTAQIELPGAVARDVFVGRISTDPSFLEITGGGRLVNRDGYLGYSFGSQGVATVSGDGSTWNTSLQPLRRPVRRRIAHP